jgi:hypothetical protein
MSSDEEQELHALAEHLGVDVEFLRECVRHGVIVPTETARSAAQLARLRRLQRLCHGLELDVFAGAIIVELLERLDELQPGR